MSQVHSRARSTALIRAEIRASQRGVVKLPDETVLRAIDRATRWVFLRVYADPSEASSVDFLECFAQSRADEAHQAAHR